MGYNIGKDSNPYTHGKTIISNKKDDLPSIHKKI